MTDFQKPVKPHKYWLFGPPNGLRHLLSMVRPKESQANQELKSSAPTITMAGGVFVLACPLELLMDK